MPLPIILLILVFLAVAIRKIGPWRLPIWLIMLTAAVITLLTGHISVTQAYHALSFNVLFYLFGVFVIGQALESSHYLEHVSLRIFSGAKSLNGLLCLIILIFGLSSALLMNDTIAIIGVPVIILLSSEHDFDAKPFLLALAYSVTLGSVFSPIGNPQNLLIASQGMENPFVHFIAHLAIPTIINLGILYVFIKLFYGKQLKSAIYPKKSKKVLDKKLSRLSQLALGLMLLLILFKVALSVFHVSLQFHFSLIAIIACAPILLFSNQRLKIIKHLDWHTLLFFVGLFIFIESVSPVKVRKEIIIEGVIKDIWPWVAEAVSLNGQMKDSRGNQVAQILDKRIELAEKSVTTSDGRLVVSRDPLKRDVYIRAKIKILEQAGNLYFYNSQKVGVGSIIWIFTPEVDLEKIYITNITDLPCE